MEKKFKSIAQVVIEIRNDKHLSQAQLAVLLGYKNSQFISNVERGLCSLPAKVIPIFCHKLNVPKHKLVLAMIEDYRCHLIKVVGLEK